MKLITKSLIATSLTVAMSLFAQQQSGSSSSSSSDKSSSDKSQQEEKSKGGTGSQTEQSAGSQSSESITDLKELSTATDTSSLQGKRVHLKDAKVQQVFGQDALTLTSEEAAGKEILVKSQRPFENVKAGQTVSVMGSVRQMPQDPSQLGIDQTAAQKIQGQKFYIQAQRVKPSDQP